MSYVDWSDESTVWMQSPYWKAADLESFEAARLQAPSLVAHIWLRSSGTTTSAPVFYALSKLAFLRSAEAVNSHLNVTENDIWLKCLPSFHVGGLSILARSYQSGCQVEELETWSADEFCRWVEEKSVTISSLVPTQVYDLCRLGKPAAGSLRAVVVGGDALDQDLYLQARSLGYPVLPSYGSTETCSQIATADLQSLAKQEEVPPLAFLKHVKVEPTSRGTLKVYSESLFTGKLAIGPKGKYEWEPRKQPYFLTSDLVELKERRLVGVERPGDLLKISGESVSLRQVRQRLLSLVNDMGLNWSPQSFEVVGIPDKRAGFQLALLTTNSLLESETFIGVFNDSVSGVEKVRRIFQLEEIPRSSLGKPLQPEILNWLAPRL